MNTKRGIDMEEDKKINELLNEFINVIVAWYDEAPCLNPRCICNDCKLKKVCHAVDILMIEIEEYRHGSN